MARLDLILQAVTENTHAAAIRELLAQDPEEVLISVGYVNEAGVAAIERALETVASKSTFFIGIRNGVTTVQGVKRLVALKAKVYAVDTGSTRDPIFHPKVYLVRCEERAFAIVGSANLTFPGLHNNIEASAVALLDISNEDDRKFLEATLALFADLVKQHPRHIFQIADAKAADELFEAGRLSDELVVRAPHVESRAGKGQTDTLPPMNLRRVAHARLARAVPKKTGKASRRVHAKPVAPATPGAPPAKTAVAAPVLPADEFYLVWESKPLEERDLNIPKGPNTHVTGSMSLDKGMLEEVDHRHFFYDEIFADLRWTPKPGEPHLRTAAADFELVIKGVNYGRHKLTLTHNTRTESKSYKQKNAMTGLRWGSVKDLIRNRDLMGRTLSLYRRDTSPPEYMIEID